MPSYDLSCLCNPAFVYYLSGPNYIYILINGPRDTTLHYDGGVLLATEENCLDTQELRAKPGEPARLVVVAAAPIYVKIGTNTAVSITRTNLAKLITNETNSVTVRARLQT